jgi:hypothetical protein
VNETRSAARRLVPGAALLAALAFGAALVSHYVSSELTFYFWDQAVHHDLTVRLARAFTGSAADGFAFLAATLREDYNALFALPLLPFVFTLGEGRLPYVLAVAFVYVVPLALATGGVAKHLVRGEPAAVFWATAAIALLTPATWVPALRGFPDAAGALFVMLALRAAIQDPWLRGLASLLALGTLLALAVVLRRHFLFAASALLAALCLHAAVDRLRRGPADAAVRDLGRFALRLTGAVSIGSAAALALAAPLVRRLWQHDFYTLYRGYLNPPEVVAAFFLDAYGALAVAAGLLGLGLAARAGRLEASAALVVGLFAAGAALQWAVVVRQIGEQYSLHFTPFVVLGWTALLFALGPRPSGRPPAWAAGAAAGVLCANLVFGLADARIAYEPFPLRVLFPGNWPPQYRNDYHQLVGLVEALRDRAGTRPVLVAASSLVLNPDLVASAERALFGRDARLDVVSTPAVDSRDRYPLQSLLQAQFVVHATPLQTHLGPGRQQVVAAVHDLFAARTHAASDFAPRPQRFQLEEGVLVSLFERQAPTSVARGLATFEFLRGRVTETPGTQADWVVVAQQFPSWVTPRPDGATRLDWHPARPGAGPEATALYLQDAPPESVASGTLRFLDARCPGARLVFFRRGADGGETDLAEVSRVPADAPPFRATLALPGGGGALMLRLLPRPGQTSVDYCLLEVDALRVESR